MCAKKIDWQKRAQRLSVRLPRTQLHPQVLAWDDASRVRGPWAVAFSGGADSLALLLLLWAHWPKCRGKIVALHFNHRLRGRKSDEDQAFCRKVCASLKMRFFSKRWRGSRQGVSEAAARTARFDFFAGKLRSLGARALWLGHQQDDIAETMFMRIARGSGTAGLAAPRPRQVLQDGRIHLRPLLTLKKTEITTALRLAGCTWREDATNGAREYFRNRVRLSVLPAWRRAAERDALAGAALTRELLEEDDVALQAWLQQVRPLEKDGRLALHPLDGKPRGLVRRALHLWLLVQPAVIDLSRPAFNQLLLAVEKGTATRQSLGADAFAVIRTGHLKFERRVADRPRKKRE